MQDRYSLRFESGERGGEVVPLTTSRLTVGRKPGNDLQIAEGSVSGHHAEIRVDDSGVLLVDRGSTNGTRVGDQKITEQRLAHGDRVVFGSVALTFCDATIGADATIGGDAAAPRTVAAGSLPDDDDDDVHSISAANLARSGKGSKLGMLVLLLVAVGGGGGAAWWFLKGEGGSGRSTRPVVPVDGNLLAGSYSFEGDEPDWQDDEGAEAAFLQRASAARTGERGMRAQLEAGELARLISPEQRASSGGSLRVQASFDAETGVAGRVGIAFRFSGEDGHTPGEQFAWSDWSTPDAGWAELAVSVGVPKGAANARVIVEARSQDGGTVDLDDVSLTRQTGGGEPTSKYRDFEGYLLGEPAQSLTIAKVDRVLVADLHTKNPSRPLSAARIELTKDGEEFRLVFPGSGSDRVLSLRAEPATLDGGLASLGAGGRKVHGVNFERDDVEALLLGKGFDLMRLYFDTPVHVKSHAEGDGARIEIAIGSMDHVAFEVDFHSETAAARGLAERARDAEGEDRMGDAYAAWRELRDVYPYDEALLADAEASMQRLAQGGLDDLVAVGENVERARFFRLRDAYRLCRDQAQEVGRRYSGTVVETEAQALIQEIDDLSSGLETELAADEVRRLRGILAALQASESPLLSAEVRHYLETEYEVRD